MYEEVSVAVKKRKKEEKSAGRKKVSTRRVEKGSVPNVNCDELRRECRDMDQLGGKLALEEKYQLTGGISSPLRTLKIFLNTSSACCTSSSLK